MQKKLYQSLILKAVYGIILQCCCVTMVFAATSLRSQGLEEISVDFSRREMTLAQAFDLIEQRTDLKFFYLPDQIDVNRKVQMAASSANLREVLQQIANENRLEFRRINEQIVVKRASAKGGQVVESVFDPQSAVSGVVTDSENGEPLVGVTVMIKGTAMGTITDIDGAFKLDVPADATMLVFSFVGYERLELAIGGKTSFNVQLVPDTQSLEEVVVIGYGDQTREDVTGSMVQLTSENFRQGINTSADNLLQGKIAGVRVVPTSGEPGAGINVTIRGVGSIRSGSTPLFVVDGVPLSNDNVSPTGTDVGFGSSAAQNPLNFLNANDIESINVLKDASATAIYGARGSNGVVIITTKRATKKEGEIALDSYVGVSSLMKKLDVMTAGEYRKAISTSDYDHGGNTDWQDVIFRSAMTYNNMLSFSKKTDFGNYYVSLGRMDQQGIVNHNDLARTTARINASESFLDDERLKIKLHLTASEIKDNAVPTSDDGGSNGQLIVHTLMANPTQPVRDENGDYTNFNMNAHYNPAYLLSIYDDETHTLRVLSNLEASFRIIKGLEYKLNVGVDRAISERDVTIYPNVTDLNPTGKYVQNNLEAKSTLLEHYLTYNQALGGHVFTWLAGFSYQKFENSGTSFAVTGIADKGDGVAPKYNPGYEGTLSTVSGSAQENELQSFFGRMNYSYQDKYLLTASMRVDGSTRFGENNKYGYFPSFAAGWNISDESFLTNASWLDNMKIRASWGQTGNQEVQNKITQASYASSGADGYYLYDNLDLTNGVTINRTPNPNLKWEVSTQYDFGVDFSLLSGKLYGTIDYYNKATTDAILNIASQPLSPTDNVWVNMGGKIVNQGIEVTLGSQLVKTGRFSWNVDVNGTTLDNVIKGLPVSEIYSGVISGPGQSGVLANIYKSGYEAGSFYLLKHIGFDEDGYDKFQDTNQDGSISNDDRVIIQGALPNFNYGVNSRMTYGAFEFSFSIIGQTGGYLLNNTGLNALNINNLASDRNVLKKYYDSGANPANSPTLSTYYLESSNFIRLNSARLGYKFNTVKVKWLSSATVYVTGQNLLTITNYSGFDPLINSPKSSSGNQSIGIDYPRYPTARSFMLGVSVKL